MIRFEPTTSCLVDMKNNQLNHAAIIVWSELITQLILKSGCQFREKTFLLLTVFNFCIFFLSATPAGILGATSLTLGTSIEPPSTTISGGNGASSILPPGGIGLGVKPPSPEQPLFMCPRRPNIGREVSFVNI